MKPHTNARLMSRPSSAPDDTSPVLSVRSSEAPAKSNHVSGTASPQEPEAITSTRSSPDNGLATTANSLYNGFENVKQLPNLINGHSGTHNNVGSDPNTPRLPPARNGSNDLENIPQEATSSLNYLNQCISDASLSSAEASKYHFPSPRAPLQNFSSSVSEPGRQGAEDSPIFSKQLPDTARGQGGSRIKSWLEASQLPNTFRFPKSPISPTPTRTKSLRFPISSRMSGTWGHEAGDILNAADRSAREEAFSDKRNRSSSRSSQSRVEKRIEATLAEAEPASHARSRKSSHTLGLFKETTAPQTAKRTQERSRTASDNAVNHSVSAGIRVRNDTAKLSQHDQLTSIEKKGKDEATETQLSASKEHERHGHESRDVLQRARQSSVQYPFSRSSEDFATGAESGEGLFVDESEKNIRTLSYKPSDASKHSVPPRLLEEIRNYHNLTAPFHDKFRSNQLKPTGPIWNKTELEALSQTRDDSHALQDDVNILTEARAKGEDIEEEESEHISSILYNPHQAPSPDALEDVSIDNARKNKEESADSGTQLPEPALPAVEGNENGEDVDIALQVHNKNRYFHGDLSKAQLSSIETTKKQLSEGGFSSASESDYESQDENRPPGGHEDFSFTDDAEATPRASPNTRKSCLASRSRKLRRNPATPLGAVELKPFNHQVGGHTNLFRFSKRAVCKQLSKRENEFYEVVERQHPELLKFLPKYDLPLFFLHSL